MMKAKKAIAVVLGVLMSYTLAVLALALLLNAAGTYAPIMEHMMLRHAPAPYTQLDKEDYAPMAEMITGYLAGSVDTFQYERETPEGPVEVFHDYEQQHMADCKALFDLCRKVLLYCAVMLAVIGGLLALLKCEKQGAIGCAGGACVMIACGVALCIWALIDFNGLFVLFHELSFANSLWMLNPATDMLIRLMPLSFFINYAATIGIVWAIVMLLLLAFSIIRAKH